MSGIIYQVEAFLFTMILGLCSGIILHYYQILVRKASVAKVCLYISDLIFWILMVMVVFLSMLYINQGEMRSYVLIALIIGGLIYFRVLSKLFAVALSKLADNTITLVKLLIKALYYFPRDILYRIKKIVVIHRKKDDSSNDEEK